MNDKIGKDENGKVDKLLTGVQEAFTKWKAYSFEQRQTYLIRLSAVLRENKAAFGGLITEEMGKPISQSLAEVEKCIGLVDYYASAENVLKEERVETDYEISMIRHEPMGIVLGVMPWNFPFWQVLRFAVPALLAGNAVVVKHASICLGSGRAIERCFRAAGFPQGIFTHVEASHEVVEEMIGHSLVRAVSLTGSEAAGRRVAEIAGRHLKKCVLELGGNDAFIVLDDAEVDKAAEDAALARLQNSGQTCVAAKRFIVHEGVYEAFMQRFLKAYQSFSPGIPTDARTVLGAMARKDLAQELRQQYEKAIGHGAEILLPLTAVGDQAFEPGLLLMNEDNPVADEELFGPLGMVFKVRNDEQALEIANATAFGLGNAVYTKSKEKALFFARSLESGSVAVNQIFRSDVRMPFSGRKNSGYGVEMSLYTLHEFTVKKSIIGFY
ncbi:aldehyde dehydrogenase family protein [Bergeyella sp. RCAD1439]|uniref:aldehyde dehydrogenase family protein n=1 Tax=Bergeyella anatis TaxID=3113737 RepID=UPI002E189BFE|nr:aldehyde dehydrogenase family protein [Bergeyella sp. RCAD1439]